MLFLVCRLMMMMMMVYANTPRTTTTRNTCMNMLLVGDRVTLPAPVTTGGAALNDVLAQRRSMRSYYYAKNKPVTNAHISQLLWAAQGISTTTNNNNNNNERKGHRTAPSAGAKFPLELYVIVNATAVFHYEPHGHELKVHRIGTDLMWNLSNAGYDQEAIGEASLNIVITAVYARTESKYGSRAARYVHLEAGHCAQNILLQAVALGLGGVSIGAFNDQDVQEVLGLPANHEPLYIIPIGWPVV